MNRTVSPVATRGFSLLELITVVAIVSVLAAVAIPGYRGFQAKARTAEARIHLSAMFQAEKAFVIENGSYTNCLRSIGFSPEGFGPGPLAVATYRGWYHLGIVDPGFPAWLGAAQCGVSINTPCNTLSWRFDGTVGAQCPTGAGRLGNWAYDSRNFANPTLGPRNSIDNYLFLQGAQLAAQGGLNRSRFRLMAAGSIRNGKPADVWYITESKEIVHFQVGY